MERHNRFFAQDLDSQTVELSVAEAHHAMHVLRMRPGDEVELFDGRGRFADARIVEARHGKVSVSVTGRHRMEERTHPEVHLAFAAPKGKRLDWLLEKVTELEAVSLTPVSFERSVVEPGELRGSKRERWLGHCVAAAKQAGVNWLPELRGPVTLPDYLRNFDRARGTGLIGSASADAALVRDALACASPDEVHVLIGPEGGITDAEYAAAEAAGFKRVRLGASTLRVETACIALVAAAVALTQQ